MEPNDESLKCNFLYDFSPRFNYLLVFKFSIIILLYNKKTHSIDCNHVNHIMMSY